MKITAASIEALRAGFKTNFMNGLGMAAQHREKIATTVPSSTKSNTYGWIGKMPNMREWIGPRVINGIAEHDYSIKNKSFELTVGVDRDDIDDDQLGTYAPLFTEMGQSTAAHPEILVFEALKNGFATECYDGQFFFDTDHPVLDENMEVTSVSNTGGGAGTPWFLLCTNRALKPIIFQERKRPEFVSRDRVTDDNVFDLKEFRYGVDARHNVGYGFWQMAYGSKQTFDAAAYAAARTALMNMKGDHGRPLGLVPNLLVVPPSLESAALKVLNNELGSGGETNEWKGTAELLVTSWLA